MRGGRTGVHEGPPPEADPIENREIAQRFGEIEAETDEAPQARFLSDAQLGQEIARKSKLDPGVEPDELHPAALKLGGSAWVPSSYWDADYRRRLDAVAQEGPKLRDRKDPQASERSELMLDTVIFALEDPSEHS